MRSVNLLFGLVLCSLISVAVLAASPSYAAVKPANRNEVPTMSSHQERVYYMRWFVKLTATEYGEMRGKKLNFFEKWNFRATQNKMKRQLRAEGSADSEGVNWGGLALGVFLGPLGVIGAYLFSKDKNFRKWTWIGFGVTAVILLIFGRTWFAWEH